MKQQTTNTHKKKTKSTMKKTNQNLLKILCILTIIIFSTIISYSQVGSSISFSTDKALGFNVFYATNNNYFYLGYSQQFNGQKNTVVTERKKTYGTTPIENGDYYWLVDLGYSRLFYEKFNIQPELSFGSKRYFTSYKDNRFSDNGYSLVNNSEQLVGIGLNLGYKVSDLIEPFCGYHSIKKLNFGVRIHLNYF